MNPKSISVILVCIALSSALGLSGYLTFDINKKHTELQLDYDSLVNNHNLLQSNHHELESNYETLNNTHRILASDFTQLNQTHQILISEYNELNVSYRILVVDYTELEQDYDELSVNYTMLEQNYTDLFNNYNALLRAFNEPLSYEEVPSTDELEQWLAIDETDEIQYGEPNFVCGDFSVMLSLHAKSKHWDIGVVGVFGYDEFYQSFDHAFNAMICDEGLVYIEPQTDEVWWYSNHEEISEGTWWEFPDYGYIYVEEYIIILWYD